jgi:hypothetical protein
VMRCYAVVRCAVPGLSCSDVETATDKVKCYEHFLISLNSSRINLRHWLDAAFTEVRI